MKTHSSAAKQDLCESAEAEREAGNTVAFRDTLLRKRFSGELRMMAAERFASEAT